MGSYSTPAIGILPIELSPQNRGLGRVDDEDNPAGSVEVCNELLKKNHESWDMYFRDVAGHNHIPHALLSTWAMGGGPEELRRAYNDGEPIQRPLPSIDSKAVQEMLSDTTKAAFRKRMNFLSEYANYLVLFEQEIEKKGWQEVFNEYCFSRSPLADYMLAQMFEGLFHPLIHAGFGIEFEMPSIVAEGLAHAASHDAGGIDEFFQRTEKLAQSGAVPIKPLIKVYEEIHTNERIRTAPRLSDGPFRVRDGVLGRAMEDIVPVAAKFQIQKPVTQERLERATAEMINCAAYVAGASQKQGKECRIDFFIMHNVTCSIFFTALIHQSWITLEDKARLVEWKARLDLVWYASCAAPALRPQDIQYYQPSLSAGMTWKDMYRAINKLHDDGHAAKFVRALKNGEDTTKPYEESKDFPTKGDMWFKIAQICFDSTSTDAMENQDKWVWGAGFEAMWNKFPNFVGYNINAS